MIYKQVKGKNPRLCLHKREFLPAIYMNQSQTIYCAYSLLAQVNNNTFVIIYLA